MVTHNYVQISLHMGGKHSEPYILGLRGNLGNSCEFLRAMCTSQI